MTAIPFDSHEFYAPDRQGLKKKMNDIAVKLVWQNLERNLIGFIEMSQKNIYAFTSQNQMLSLSTPKNNPSKGGFLFLGLLLFSTPFAANAVYKCTDASGKATYSQIPCASDAAKLDVEESERRKEQIETNIAVKKLITDAQQREFEEKQKEAERIWRENEQLRLQREIILRQNAIANETRKMKQKLDEPKGAVFCDPLPNGHSICF